MEGKECRHYALVNQKGQKPAREKISMAGSRWLFVERCVSVKNAFRHPPLLSLPRSELYNSGSLPVK